MKFDDQETVVCINDEFSNGRLQVGEYYQIVRQTVHGYVWVSHKSGGKVLAPFIPERFQPISK